VWALADQATAGNEEEQEKARALLYRKTMGGASHQSLLMLLRSVGHAAGLPHRENDEDGEPLDVQDLKDQIAQLYPAAARNRINAFHAPNHGLHSNLTDQELKKRRQLCHFNGLQCLESDSAADLDNVIKRATTGGSIKRDYRGIGGYALDHRFPVRGRISTLHSSKGEAAVHDLICSAVSLKIVAFDSVSEAICQARYAQTLVALLGRMDSRVCNGCGKTHVKTGEGYMFECNHVYCQPCCRAQKRFNKDMKLLCPHESCQASESVSVRARFHMTCHRCQAPFQGLKDVVVLGCGHAICEACQAHMVEAAEQGDSDLQCLIGGCGCLLGGRIFRATDVITDPNVGSQTVASLGAGGKLEKMAAIVRQIKLQEQKVLIFVPYEQQVAAVEKTLRMHNIRFRSTLVHPDMDVDDSDSDSADDGGNGPSRSQSRGPSRAARKPKAKPAKPKKTMSRQDKEDYVHSAIHEFQTRPKITALIQVVSGVEASGSNLVEANHVMFVSPLFSTDQEKWDMCRKQAVGRCYRYGQKRDVNVYHIVAENTIEPDILGHHLGVTLRREPGRDFIVMPPECRTVDPDPTAQTVLDGEEIGCKYPKAELEFLFRNRLKGDTDAEGIF
jgi:hypothetical protein